MPRTSHALKSSVRLRISNFTQRIEDSLYTGICFGHQVVARALGGECVSNSKWEVAVTEVILTDLGHRIFGVPSIVRLHSGSSCYVPNVEAEHPTNAPRPCTHDPPIISSAWVDDHD